MKAKGSCMVLCVMLLSLSIVIIGIAASADELNHDTQTEFAPGIFFQTVLEGTEGSPEIRLDSYMVFDWFFDDDDISGWSYNKQGSNTTAEENPAGQIHLQAQYDGSESYAYSYRTDVSIPDQFSIEYLIYIDAMDPSGVEDPMVDQPTGACCRLDVAKPGVGFRMDIFSDRMVSFYREGTSGSNYPTIAYFDITTNTGQWYTLRFDIDFTDPDLEVQVYRDGGWIGELKADTRNTSGQTVRQLAYSRGSASGNAEFHIDRVRLGTECSEFYSTGTYTSPIEEINAISLDMFSWTEIPANPYPWAPWEKYNGNPVIPAPSLVENMLVDIWCPRQIPRLYDDKYWLSYATGGGAGTIRLAYTTDPELLTWTLYEGNPILSPGTGENYVFSPHLCREGDTYYLFYDVSLSSDGRQRIAYATADAPTGPYTKGQIILDRGAPGEWDEYRVSEPFVYKEGDTYYMYYMGDHACSGCNEQIGLATTTEAYFPLGPETGGLWTKHGMVLPHNPDPSGWDRGLTADPSIIKNGDIYFMRYTGSYANEHWELGTAWATNLYGPWQRPSGPDISLGPPGAWDDDRLVRGAIHYHNGKWYSPYTGNGGSGYMGGMAYADSASLFPLLTFETRTSPDGSSWEEWMQVENGGSVQSTPDRYFQYQATFNLSADDLSPTLTSVTLMYEPEPPIATLLKSYSTYIRESIITIKWTLTQAEDGMRYGILRAEERDGTFEEIVDPNIHREGLSFTFKDDTCEPGTRYSYRIGIFDEESLQILFETDPISAPVLPLTLRQNCPNPFNPSTTINYYLPDKKHVFLTVYDVQGRKIVSLVNEVQPTGWHTVTWNGRDANGISVSSGIYFYRLVGGKETISRKMILLR